jgi:hypothetical protein
MDQLVLTYECPLLNIGDKKGYWGYIDFIREEELRQTAVVKGQDCINRPFLAIKAEFVLENGSTVPVFATLYQKYVNNKNIWQCFNYPEMELLKTSYMGEGYPIDAGQIALITALLHEKRISLDSTIEGLFFHPTQTPIVALQLRADRRSSFYT